MKIANRDARQYVQQCKPFEGNNLYGKQRALVTADDTVTWYTVYSYGEHYPMFIHINGMWFENEDRYDLGDSFSRTTPRHKSLCHPHEHTFPLSTRWMRVLAEQGYVALAKMRVTQGVTWL